MVAVRAPDQLHAELAVNSKGRTLVCCSTQVENSNHGASVVGVRVVTSGVGKTYKLLLNCADPSWKAFARSKKSGVSDSKCG